jgi:hypothetical protein
MKQFSFKLDTALKWRSAQKKTQEVLLQTLYRDQELVGKQLLTLLAEYRRAEETARFSTSCGGATLAALSRYRLAYMKVSANLTMRFNQLAISIEKQKSALRNATRDYELLVKLEDREFRQWETDYHRRVESDAAEAFLMRWQRK